MQVSEKDRELLSLLSENARMPVAELARTAVASSFGATLEMARDGLIELRQEAAFAPIYMRRREAGAEWERLS